jgi:hypothetical protein
MYKYRNSHVQYVKQLFQDLCVSKPKGRLVAISNGGYNAPRDPLLGDMPEFGYRIYHDKAGNVITCQVISKTANLLGGEYFREYSVPIENVTPEEKADSVQTAVLYTEYRHRTLFDMRSGKHVW